MTNLSNPKRKINLLITVAGLHPGGAEVVIKHLVHHIDRKLFNVTVLCIKAHGFIGEELLRDGFDIISLDTLYKPKIDYFTFIKVYKIIRLKKIDIIHTHTNDALADAAVCKLLMPRLKLIHTFHFGNYPGLRWRQMWIEQVFSRVVDRLIAVGETQRRQIRQVFGYPLHRIRKIWNGVLLPTSSVDSTFRSRINAEKQIVVGTIATLIKQKGLFDFLAVAARLRVSDNRVKFVIVGDGPLRAVLEAKSNELGLEDSVVFTGWVMNATEVALPTFDVFFQPSLWEAMSMVVLEAMAAEKPVVATRVGENSRIIENGRDGLLVNTGDISGMEAALRRLMDDPDLRDRLGKAAASKVKRQFTVVHMRKAYQTLYLEEFKKSHL